MGLKYQVTLNAKTESRIKYKFIWLQFVSRMNSNYMVEDFREKKVIPRVVSSMLNIHFDNIPLLQVAEKIRTYIFEKKYPISTSRILIRFYIFFEYFTIGYRMLQIRNDSSCLSIQKELIVMVIIIII